MNPDVEFFSRVATATVADTATALGMNLVMEGLRPAVPGTLPRAVGAAATMVFAPIQAPRKAPYSLYDVVERFPAGSIAIVAAAGSPLAAWGGGASRTCLRRGAVGAVIDGATRDVEDIRALNFPVWCLSVWSNAFPRRLEVVARDVPVQCCGVQVEPGDIVIADIDGVAVVPWRCIPEVRRHVERIQAIEKEVSERFKKGESMADLFPLLAKKFTTD